MYIWHFSMDRREILRELTAFESVPAAGDACVASLHKDDLAMVLCKSLGRTVWLTCRFAEGVAVCWEEDTGWLAAAELDSAGACGA